ncbi:MAG: UbiX family flavin prenyltransferase [Bacteroidales bacterium]|nr:UbiX family flavin prenyltransferase [Bacteroidales bacterium]
MQKKKIVVAITGASGMIYAQRLLHKLCSEEIKPQLSEVALVFSDNVKDIWDNEINTEKLSDFNFPVLENNNFYVPFASGSSAFDVMIIIPCSMGTLGRIAAGTSENLIGRTADVMFKERKKTILVTREMPLSIIHINNMKTVTEAGGIICPASPTFYNQPANISELTDTVVERVLDLAGFKQKAKRWK